MRAIATYGELREFQPWKPEWNEGGMVGLGTRRCRDGEPPIFHFIFISHPRRRSARERRSGQAMRSLGSASLPVPAQTATAVLGSVCVRSARAQLSFKFPWKNLPPRTAVLYMAASHYQLQPPVHSYFNLVTLCLLLLFANSDGYISFMEKLICMSRDSSSPLY